MIPNRKCLGNNLKRTEHTASTLLSVLDLELLNVQCN